MKNVFKYIVCLCALMVSLQMAGQTDRDYIRQGNRLFHDKNYVKAEAQYRKALSKNSTNTIAMYNLGNALLAQRKPKEAMQQYERTVKIEKNKVRLAKAYHNMGVIFQSQKNYGEAIKCYKNSLRRNPSDNETRYNLALCQRMQQQNPPQKNQQQKQKNKNKNNKDNKDKNKNNNQNQKDKDRQKQPDRNKMSKDNAEQLLNAVMQDERNIQDKMRKMQRAGGKSLEQNW